MDDGPVELTGTSVEKLDALMKGAASMAAAADEQGALAQTLLRAISPLLKRLIPTDPAELDRLLLAGAGIALKVRSDDSAVPPSIEELMNPPEPVEGTAEEEPE